MSVCMFDYVRLCLFLLFLLLDYLSDFYEIWYRYTLETITTPHLLI